jgi:Flp pilus assembly protein TadG
VKRADHLGVPTGRRGRNGQSLAEFALVIPIFLLMVLGLVDVARLVYLNSTLSQAAREGARVGAVEASWMGKIGSGCNTANGPVCPANSAALRTDVTAAANRMMAPFGGVSNVYLRCDPKPVEPPPPPPAVGTSTTCTNPAALGLISVRTTATFTAITPLIGQLIGPRNLESSSTFVIN